MGYLALSVVCSVLVSVLLKLAPRWRVDVGQAVMWNYLAASVLALLMLHPALTAVPSTAIGWSALAGLGLLLPTVFVVLGASVREAGIVRTDAAQRLSLLLSLLAAFALFGEPLSLRKGLGIGLGLVALALMVWRPRHAHASGNGGAWTYPLVVFVGFAAIDILLKRVAAGGTPLGTALLAMFVLSLVVAAIIQFARAARGRTRFTARSAGGGLLLGLGNFGNILFYLRAHQALPHQPALVFASVNLGVVALGALVGVLVFRERLGALNAVGVLLAFIAIATLTVA